MGELKKYTDEEVKRETLKYFDKDELATDVWIKKYALRNEKGELLEKTPDDMHKRLAREFARIEAKYPNAMKEQEIYDLLKGFKYICPQGSPMAAIGNNYQIMSLSNCFVIRLYDSYAGIANADQELIHIYRRRGGCGLSLDPLRPNKAPTKNAAKFSSGIIPFMERFSNTTREVATQGRRGAQMQTLSVHHYQIEDFINVKRDKTKITGANISVMLTDEFLYAVERGEKYQQRFPVNEKVNPKMQRWVDARYIWDQIIDAAHDNGEPGIIFQDTVLRNGPADIYYPSISTNPSLRGDSKILTKDGAFEIKDLEGKNIEIKNINGEWKQARCFKSGYNKQLYRVMTGNTLIYCTGEHQWPVFSDIDNFTTFKLVSTKNIAPNEYCIKTIDNKFERVRCESTNLYEDVYDISVSDETHTFCVNNVFTSNCSEIPLSDRSSCKLLLLNLTGYIKNQFTDDAEFDYKLFEKHCYFAQKLMDDIVDLEAEQIGKIIAKINSDPEPESVKQVELNLWKDILKDCVEGRRTGLGITGLGDALAFLNVRYGCDESIKISEKIYKALAIGSYKATIDMAQDRGSFKLWDYEKEKEHSFLKNIIFSLPKEFQGKYKKYGRRNVALTTTAPAGSVSCLTRTTSGVEPAYLLEYTRRRKINPEDKKTKVDFVDKTGDSWQEYKVLHPGFEKWKEISGKSKVEDSPYYKATSNDIDWEKGIELQAACQKWICHSISKTVNIPESASKELVKKIYTEAWKRELKGVTIYRDKSRSGVLVTSDSEKPTAFATTHAPKRPKELLCDIKHITVHGEKWIILVGLMDDKVYEVIGGLASRIEIPKKYSCGKLTKNSFKTKNNTYDLSIGENGSEFIIKDVVDMFDNPNYAALTRMVSLGLRHGAKIKYIVEQLQKDKDSDMQSFSKCLARVLKSYIQDGEAVGSDKVCPECKAEKSLVYQEGCMTCKSCGYSKCS